MRCNLDTSSGMDPVDQLFKVLLSDTFTRATQPGVISPRLCPSSLLGHSLPLLIQSQREAFSVASKMFLMALCVCSTKIQKIPRIRCRDHLSKPPYNGVQYNTSKSLQSEHRVESTPLYVCFQSNTMELNENCHIILDFLVLNVK